MVDKRSGRIFTGLVCSFFPSIPSLNFYSVIKRDNYLFSDSICLRVWLPQGFLSPVPAGASYSYKHLLRAGDTSWRKTNLLWWSVSPAGHVLSVCAQKIASDPLTLNAEGIWWHTASLRAPATFTVRPMLMHLITLALLVPQVSCCGHKQVPWDCQGLTSGQLPLSTYFRHEEDHYGGPSETSKYTIWAGFFLAKVSTPICKVKNKGESSKPQTKCLSHQNRPVRLSPQRTPLMSVQSFQGKGQDHSYEGHLWKRSFYQGSSKRRCTPCWNFLDWLTIWLEKVSVMQKLDDQDSQERTTVCWGAFISLLWILSCYLLKFRSVPACARDATCCVGEGMVERASGKIFLSHLFNIPKSGFDKHQLVVNLNRLKHFISTRKFYMFIASQLTLCLGSWFSALDLDSVNWHITRRAQLVVRKT